MKCLGKVATARHVIFLYMAGGMTHVDTFDPKPQNKEVMGETNAISTTADGIQIGHWLPKTAQQMHNASLIRSLTSNQGKSTPTSKLFASYFISTQRNYQASYFGKLGKSFVR